MKYRVIKSFPGNLSVGDLVYIEHPLIRYEKNGEEYKLGINEKDIEEYFKKEVERPMSWEDLKKIGGFWVNVNGEIVKQRRIDPSDGSKNTRPTKEMAEAQLALSQLMQLRDSRRNGWKPGGIDRGYSCFVGGKDNDVNNICSLSFKKEDDRDEFQKTFLKLIKTATPLFFS